jgi:hypothetical protein
MTVLGPPNRGLAPRLYPCDLHSCDDVSSLPTGMVYFQATTEGFVSLMSFPYSRKLGALKSKSFIFIIALSFNQFSSPFYSGFFFFFFLLLLLSKNYTSNLFLVIVLIALEMNCTSI